MKDRFLIIGGTTKAGTTSVFEYLGDHPQICKSSMKETRFFLDPSYPIHSKYRLADGMDKYLEFFSVSEKPGSIKTEATPDYLYCDKAPENMSNSLKDLKIIFILRDPVSRMMSWFNFSKQMGQLPNETSFEEYVNMQELNPEINTKQYLRAMEQGRYSLYLDNYLKVMSKEQIHICFLENMESNVRTFMKKICEFSEIDPGFYDLYDFRRHNKTMHLKNPLVHKIYSQYSYALRKITHNKKGIHTILKKIKKVINPIYLMVNSKKVRGVEIPDDIHSRLRKYYEKEFQIFNTDTYGYPWK